MRNVLLSTFLLLVSFTSNAATGVFSVLDQTGSLVGSDNAVTASIIYPGTGSSIASPTPFFGIPWTTHDITTYPAGTYTIGTSQGGSYTFTVAANQIGAHILFDWSSNTNIDVVEVWDVTESAGVVSYTSSDWDGDGVTGGAMIEGPFPGLTINFELNGGDLPLVISGPGITLNGPSTVSVQTGVTYVDAGATATDAEDGDLTASIITTNPVDTSIAGTYTVSYSVTDSDSNNTVSTRTVIVIQGEIPGLTLNGVSPVSTYTIVPYIDAGATATDAEDGDITATIVTSSNVDVSNAGSYSVTYSITDSDGNSAVATRVVNVISGNAPLITLNGLSSVVHVLGDTYVDAGATASDIEDGNLSGSIVVSNSVNSLAVGVYGVTYNVTDAHGNAATQVSRTVEVIDPNVVSGSMTILDTAGNVVTIDNSVVASIVYPGFGSSISSPTPFFGIPWMVHDVTTYQNGTHTVNTFGGGFYTFTVGQGQIGMHALVDWAGNVDIDVVNVWDVTEFGGIRSYTVTDWDGDGVLGGAMIDGPFIGFNWNIGLSGAALPAANNSPSMTLIGDSSVQLQTGDIYIDAGATASDAEDGDLTGGIAVTNSVDTSMAGIYTVSYSVTDSDGNTSTLTRTVDVVQGAFPVISLNGMASVSVYLLTAYVDAGVTASDAEDGDISATVVTNNTVDTSTVGSYSVTYTVTDIDGNTTFATRSVNVITGDVPVISMNGISPVTLELGDAYFDAGATASDTEDGVLTAGIVINNPVNTSIAGTYFVSYDVTDSNGNSATQIRRTVEVIDPDISGGVLQVYDPTGISITNDNTLTSSIVYPTGSSITSTMPFFGFNWFVHDITIYGAGTHTAGSYTFTVAVGQIGSYMLVDWAGTVNIEVVNVWDVTETVGVVRYTSSDWDGDGIPGGAMITGPFPGFSWVVDLVGGSLPIVENVPAITLNGLSHVTLNVGNTYVDAGATASDVEDGDLTPSILVTNPVDTSIAGSYAVTYSVTDSDGNTETAVRTVVVIKGQFPVLSLNGVTPETVYLFDTYMDAGVTANDTEDGNISNAVISSGTVDTSVAGNYTIAYSVSDSDGNTTVASRNVNVIQGAIPFITLAGNVSEKAFLNEAYVDAGATASDTEDGDITLSMVVSNSVNTSVVGTYSVTFNVTDSHGNNASQITRIVNVVDPSQVSGSFSMYDPAGLDFYTDNSVTASIVYPGAGSNIASPTPFFGANWLAHDITTYPTGTHTVNIAGGGSYTFTVGAGQIGMHMLVDWSASLNMNVINVWDVTELGGTVTYTSVDWDGDGVPGGRFVDGPFPGFSANFEFSGNQLILPTDVPPVITLNGSDTVSAIVGGVYVDAGATASDYEDGDLSVGIITTSLVNTSVPGVYSVTYSVNDSAGNSASVIRTVIVTMGYLPQITLNGLSTIEIISGSSYLDEGAIASDAEDGDLTINIVATNNVNTSVLGTYQVAYNVTDSHGNDAVETVRTVNVVAESSLVGGGEFCVIDSSGSIVGCDNTVSAHIVYPGSGSTISSNVPFFGYTWLAHNITTYTEGTYTVETGAGQYTFTVGAGQVGAHMLFDWHTNLDIDVVNVWDVVVSGELVSYTSTDWDGDGVAGAGMIDGPFIGMNINFDVTSQYVSTIGNVPLINLVGATTVALNVGEDFTDSGAMAMDAEDGDLTSSVAVNDTVDTSVVSAYTLNYSVMDSDGNTASVARNVIVEELDADADGVLLSQDNCSAVANPGQRDSDADGFGNMCDADLNNDNMTNAIDLGLFKQRYFSNDADADLNGDGVVNALDLGMFKQMYGQSPGPSGLN